MKLEDAETLARRLMAEHGLTEWEFKFFDPGPPKGRYLVPRKLALGLCHFGGPGVERIGRDRYQRVERKPTISLLAPYVCAADEQMVRDTVLHEIAHALTGKTAKGAPKHGRAWRATVTRIGGKPEARLCEAAFDAIVPELIDRLRRRPVFGTIPDPNPAQRKLFSD